MTYRNVLKKNINNDNGYVLADYYSACSVAFFANIPDNAVVDTVKVGDRYLEDIVLSGAPIYPRTLKDGEMRIIAVMNGIERDKIYNEVIAGNIEQFEVFYHKESISEE